MAAGMNQRQKLLILAEIISRETDDDHGLTLGEIAACLEERDMERSTINTQQKAPVKPRKGLTGAFCVQQSAQNNCYVLFVNRGGRFLCYMDQAAETVRRKGDVRCSSQHIVPSPRVQRIRNFLYPLLMVVSLSAAFQLSRPFVRISL